MKRKVRNYRLIDFVFKTIKLDLNTDTKKAAMKAAMNAELKLDKYRNHKVPR